MNPCDGQELVRHPVTTVPIMKVFTLLYLLVSFYISISSAGFLENRNSCSRKVCEDKTNKFHYEVGKTYIYGYKTEVSTSLIGVTNDSATMTLEADVHLDILSPCELALKIETINSDTRKTDTEDFPSQDKVKYFSEALTRNPLRFGFHDGLITELCPMNDEQQWVINIKRGIISLLQNTMENYNRRQFIEEVDIMGKCETEYIVSQGFRATAVKKSRKLSTCSNHHTVFSAWQSTPLDNTLEKKNIPLLEEQQTCKQIITKGIMKHVDCEERHLLIPFSGSNSSGSQANIFQSLWFKTEKNSIDYIFPEIHSRMNLIFNHHFLLASSDDKFKQNTQQTLVQFCEQINHNIQPQIPLMFSSLIQDLRNFDSNELHQMFNYITSICQHNSEKLREIFLDAVHYVNTGNAFKFITELILQNKMLSSRADSWLFSLGLQSLPTLEMIQAVLPLLDSQEASTSLFLGISSLVHTYCLSHSTCEHDIEVQQVLRKLETMLNGNCLSQSSSEADKMLMALKAIGNIGNVMPSLHNCYNNKNVPIKMRTAAVEAFRRVSCNISREDIFKLYLEKHEPSELRIAAFLEVMRCPSSHYIMQMYKTLNDEPVNQVGSFVWSYFTNVQESDDPCKAYVQGLLADIELQKKFSSDFRKFSQAFEKSFFSEAFNVGAHADGHIIFSTNSYLPTSGKLNLTVDLFGRSINLFEFSGSLQGMESIIENYFRNRKSFPGRTTQPVRERWTIDENKLQQLSNNYMRRSSYFDEPQLSASMKIFGNELQYWSIQSETSMRQVQEFLDLQQLIMSLAEDRNIQFNRQVLLLDSHLAVATGPGFPLTLSLNSTASISLNIAGKLNIRQLSILGFNINGHIHPSAAITIDGIMQIDSHFALIGIHFHSTLHTSTYINGKFEVQGKDNIQLQVNIPENKMEFINVKSRIYLFKNKKIQELSGITQDHTDFHKCSGQYTTALFGVELCGTIHYSNASGITHAPHFPLTGPFDAKFSLIKTDSTLTHFVLQYKWEKRQIIQDKYWEHFLLTFKTPHSKGNREVTIEFIMNQPDQLITFRFLTPIKKFIFDGKYSNEIEYKSLDATVTIDEIKYTVNSYVKIENTETTSRIILSLWITTAKGPFLTLSGFIHMEVENKLLTIDLSLEHLTSKPIKLNGRLIKTEKDHFRRLDWNLVFSSPLLDATGKGYISGDGRAMNINVYVDYSWMGMKNENIEFLMKFLNEHPNTPTYKKLSVTADLKLSAYPNYNTAINWVFLTTIGQLENLFEIGFGPDAHANESKLRLKQILKYTGSAQNSTLNGSFVIEYPKWNIDFSFRLLHHSSQSLVYSQISLRLDPQQEYELNANFSDESQLQAKFTGELEFKMPSRTIYLKVRFEEKEKQFYHINADIEWDKGKKITLQGYYFNNSTRAQLSYEFKANLTMSSNITHKFYGNFLAIASHITSRGIFTVHGKEYGIGGNLTRVRRNHYQLKAYIIWKDFIYSCSGNLTLGNRIIITIDFDLGSNRIISIRSSFRTLEHQQIYSIDMFWNIYGENRTMNIYVENKRPHAGEHKVQFKLLHSDFHLVIKYDNKKQGLFQTGPYNHIMNIEIEWDKNQQIKFRTEINQTIHNDRVHYKGLINIDTPFSSMEKIQVIVVSIFDDDTWELHVTTKWPQSQVIEIVFQNSFVISEHGEHSKISLHIITPFSGFENDSINIWYFKNTNEFQGGMEVHWPQNEKFLFSLYIMENLDESMNMSGGFQLSSPWQGLQFLSAKYQHILTKKNIDSYVEIVYEHHPKLKLSISGNYSLEDYVDWKGKVLLYLPFENFQDFEITMDHFINSSAIIAQTTIFWSSKANINITLELWKQKTSSEQRLHFNANLETPFGGLQNFQIKVQLNYNQLNINAYVYIQWPPEKNVNISFKVTSQNGGIDGKLLIKTPWDGYRNINSSLEYLVQDKYVKIFVEINNQVTLFALKISGIHKNCASNSCETEIQVTLILPFKIMNYLELFLLHKHQNEMYITNGKIFYNEYEINGTHTLKFINWFNFHNILIIETSHNLMHKINFTLNQEYKKNYFNHFFLFHWKENKRIQAEALFLQDVSPNEHVIRGKIYFISPFAHFNHLGGQLLYQQLLQNYTFQGHIQFQQHTINLNAWGVFLSNSTSFNINFDSPFVGYENLKLQGNFLIGSPTIPMSAQLTLQWDPNKKIDASMLLNFHWPNPMVRFLITTPYSMMQSLELHGKQISTSDGNTIILVYRRNDELIDLSISWMTRLLYFKLDIILKTSPLDTINFTFKKDFSKPRKEMLMNVQWPSIVFFSEVKMEFSSWNSFSGNIDIRSQYKALEILEGELHFEQNENAYEGRASVKIKESFKIELFVNLKFDPHLIIPLDVSISILTPMQPVHRYKLYFALSKNNFKNTVTVAIEWNNNNKFELFTEKVSRSKYLEVIFKSSMLIENVNQFEVNCNFLNDDYNNIEGNLIVKSLSELLPFLQLSVSLQWTGQDINKVNFLLDSSAININASYEKKHLETIQAKIKGDLHIPFTNFKNSTFEMDFQQVNSRSYKATGFITISNTKYSISGRFDKDVNGFSGILDFSLPFGIHKLMTIITFSKTKDQTFEINLNATTDYKNSNLSAFIQVSANSSVLIKFHLESLYFSFHRLITFLSIKLADGFKEIQLQTTVSDKTFSNILTFKNSNWSNVIITINLNTPFKNFEHISLHGHLKKKDWLNIEAGMDLSSSLEQFSAMGINLHIIQIQDNNLNISVQIKTPFKNFSLLSLKGEVLYNDDFTMFEPRFIFNLPNKIFNVFGRLKRIPGKIELGFKVDINSEMKFEVYTIFIYRHNLADIIINIFSPIQGFENVHLATKYYIGKDDEHNIFAEMKYPKGIWLLNGTFKIKFLPNLQIDVSIKSPIKGFENISMKLEQQVNSKSYKGTIECLWSQDKRIILYLNYESEGETKTGKLEIVTPFPILRYEKITYKYQKNRNFYELFGSFIHNEKRLLELHFISEEKLSPTGNVNLFYKFHFHNPLQSIGLIASINYPTKEETKYTAFLIWDLENEKNSTFNIEIKIHENISLYEITVKTIHPNRVMSFLSRSSNSSKTSVHELKFTWDEKSKKTIYFKFVNEDLSTDDKTQYQLNISINSFLRFIEWQGNFTALKQNFSIGTKLLWDASRDKSKYLDVEFNHYNDKNVNEMKYYNKLYLFHPKAEKMIVLRGDFIASNNKEFFSIYGEADYSKKEDNKFKFYFRLLNESSNLQPQDSHYYYEGTIQHLTSGLFLNCTGNIIDTLHVKKIESHVKYLKPEEIISSYYIKGVIQKPDLVQLELASPSRTLKTTLYTNNKNEAYLFNITHQENGINKILLDFWARPHTFDADIQFFYLSEDYNSFFAKSGFETDQSFLFHIYRTLESNKAHDILMTMKLVNPYLFTFQLIWSNNFFHQMQEYINDTVHILIDDIKLQWNNIKNTLADEANYIFDKLFQATKNIIISIFQDFVIEMKTILIKDFGLFKAMLVEMYEANEFYLKDILNWTQELQLQLNELYEKLLENLHYFQDTITEELKELLEVMQNAWKSFWNNIGKKIENFTRSFKNFFHQMTENLQEIYQLCKISFFKFFQDILDVLKQIFNNVVQDLLRIRDFFSNTLSIVWKKIKEGLNKIMEKWEKIKSTIIGFFNTIKQWIINHEIYIWIRSWTIYIKNIIIQFWENFKDFIYHHMSILRKAILENEDSIIGYIVRYWRKAYDMLVSFFNKLKQHPMVVFFINSCREIYHKVHWCLAYYNLNTNIVTLGIRLYLKWQSLLQHTGYQKGIQFDTQNEVLFSLNQGQIKIVQYLPMPWYALTKTPHFHQLPEMKMYESIKSWIYRSKPSFWDLVIAYKPYLNRKKWIPPFPAVAIQNAKQHFVTFDGHYHSFVGDCTYLLAHDFITNNFTIAVNYDIKSNEKSILLILNGKEVEITSESKILINKKNAELPQKIGEITLIRDKSLIFASIAKGVEFQCNVHFQICSLSIDGSYFGKTFGLFGTYNNEPFDDLYNKEQNEEFAASFDVGSQSCKSYHNRAANFLTNKIFDTPEICLFYYQNKNSQFRYCFNQINPEPYLKMCINDVNTISDPDMAICSSANAYAIACRHMEAPIRLPRNCVQCGGLNNTMILEGDNITLNESDIKRSVDVVILVEGKKCNEQIEQAWPDLIKSIEDEFIKENFNNNRYSVVSFGNEAIFKYPHTHTADGEIFGNAKTVLSALNNVKYQDGGGDVFEALRFAAHLPFRMGVAKIYVAIICTTCAATSNTIDYPEILWMLREYNIAFHLLLKYDFKFRKQKEVYGIDKHYAYTVKNSGSSSLKGDKDLRRQLTIPKYLCIPLALETNGTVFSSPRLLDNKRKSKRFLDIFSKRIAMSAQISSCQFCDCIADSYDVGKMHCHSCFFSYSGFQDFSDERE